MLALFVLLSLCAVVSAGLKPISIAALLEEMNMTYEELFPNWNASSTSEGEDALGLSTSYVYTYHQGTAKFTGPAFDGSADINVVGCSGLQNVNYCGSGQCRNNAAAQCCKDCGPCPQGAWLISSMITYHNMPYCYALSPVGTQKCPSRDGFMIHGGDGTTCAAGNPSDGCIVIESDSIRYKIKGGGTVNVYA